MAGQRQLQVVGFEPRGSGVTMALLDVAIGNARRGEQVAFWCRHPEEAQRCYRVAADLLHQQRDHEAIFDSRRDLMIRWPDTARGSVTFRGGDERLPGFRATVVINDQAHMPGPEPAHAHTVVDGR